MIGSTLARVPWAAAALAVVHLVFFAGPAAAVGADDFPRGLLFVQDQGPFEGSIGSGCLTIQDTGICVDAPRIVPSAGPDTAPGARMRFTLADGWTISEHSASYSPAHDESAESTLLETTADDEVVAFHGPPSGDWVVDVFVLFERGDASGDAAYAFRVMTGPPDSSTIETGMRPAPPDEIAIAVLVVVSVLVGAAFAGRRRPVG